ncbi:Protein serine/threonine phosphatase PrpC, regulation of stationary phase [Serinicoccus hydrothermalis]|uniref:Protein serine/threonine phosphatase PrpC, regulation of stationary phase n=1 Tax=Serinicoccus hydrothermalis TaxID=1758689 RepID=A0A1B1NA53_9MICO|nr:protein phosphatase 2C domain-containing protein [Serinicoccus hydrothermalis]ANS78322.1 Protein serine/threonine phosphatase PrpC, regulation of stationary phase [Serinicoccus hydrothermalis]
MTQQTPGPPEAEEPRPADAAAPEKLEPDAGEQAPGQEAAQRAPGEQTPGEQTPGEEAEPEPFSEGPPPLPEPMLVLDGDLAPVRPSEPEPTVDHGTCEACGGAYDEDGWCQQCGERKPDPRHHTSAAPSAAVAAVCDKGRRHSDNEDAMAVWADDELPGRAVLVVCDGVSSAPRSAEASEAAAGAALGVLTGGTTPHERHPQAAAAAAAAVDEVAAQFTGTAPSCTYVAAVVEGGRVSVGSIGDSRAYWVPDDGEPLRLSTDDSMAEEQVRAGISRADAEAGPLGHTITRWIGPDAPDVEPEVTEQDVTAPGWLLVCSDGLWNYASEPAALAEVLAAQAREAGQEPLALAEALVGWANEQGGADNITVALARCGGTRQDGGHG